MSNPLQCSIITSTLRFQFSIDVINKDKCPRDELVYILAVSLIRNKKENHKFIASLNETHF